MTTAEQDTMMQKPPGRRTRSLGPLSRALPLIAASLALATTVTACHSGGSNDAAGNSPSTGSSSSSAASQTRSGPAYAQCMRQHGVTDFPDPQGPNQNQFLISGAVENNPHFQSASKACEPLRPQQSTGGSGGGASQQQLLAFARCMRTNGVPNFPDPGAGGAVNITGVNPNSPQFQHALQICAQRTGVHLGGQ